jgi:hypothetical protein
LARSALGGLGVGVGNAEQARTVDGEDVGGHAAILANRSLAIAVKVTSRRRSRRPDRDSDRFPAVLRPSEQRQSSRVR